ncbi:hypothetical protein LTR95_014360 [Oleoguttula sp. CCFEE 5521]
MLRDRENVTADTGKKNGSQETAFNAPNPNNVKAKQSNNEETLIGDADLVSDA